MKQLSYLSQLLVIAVLMGCLMPIRVFAQEHVITGQVVDETGYPLNGARVSANGTEVLTNVNGNFILPVIAGTRTKASFPGHKTATVRAADKMIITLYEIERLSWNARAGLNVGALFGSGDTSFGEHKLGFQVGAGAEYAFTKNWVIQPSLMFYNKVYKDTTEFENTLEGQSPGTERWVADLYVGQLNLLVGYRFNLPENFGIVLAAGPTFGYTFDGTLERTTYQNETALKTKYKIFDGAKSDHDDELRNKLDEFDRFKVGIMGSITAEYDRYFLTLETVWEKHNTSALSIGVKF